jgi:hypothetical protein
MRAACLALLLLDVSPSGDIVETTWAERDWTAATNDEFEVRELRGGVVALQIKGGGEACLIRRRILPLRLPVEVTFRMRWTECAHGNAYPSAHVIFDPPALDDEWWKQPVSPPAGGGPWSGGRSTFLFHFATDPGWRKVGFTNTVENAAALHEYSPPQKQWLEIRIRLEKGRAVVTADGREVASSEGNVSAHKTFTVAIGDQTSTRVELDELRVSRR